MPRTITDIVPPSRRRAMMQESGESTPPPATPPPAPPMQNREDGYRRPRRRGGFPYGIALVALIVVALCVGALYAFAGARVEVTPTVNATTVSGEFSATPSVGDLPFETVVVDKVVTQAVPAEGTETANEPAQGTLTVYNSQNKVQELIKNTRFETTDGLIFRIRDSVKVPAGTEAAPGTLQVTVYADAGGEKYNVGPGTFTLPGLKGGALYDMVYARSTEAMIGGFTGTRPSVGEATRTAQYESMKAALEGDLMTAIREKVPEDHILIPGSVSVTYVPQPDGAGTSGTVNLLQKGSATAVIFPKAALGKAIAYRVIGAYTGQPVAIEDAGTLTLTPSEGSVFMVGAESLSFTLSGEVSIRWDVDTAKVSGAVAGKTRDSAEAILAGFPEVERAVLVIRPFWQSTLPQDPAEIEVKVAKSADPS